jgi:hypothetical protein
MNWSNLFNLLIQHGAKIVASRMLRAAINTSDAIRLIDTGTSFATAMSEEKPPSEYLVISRGQWDKHLSAAEIQKAIDEFYVWHDRLVKEGKMRSGQRLARAGKIVSKHAVMDGPFTEAKEVVGGYWFILAGSLEEAAELAAGNPCLACGLLFEIRPIETVRASAYAVTSETPSK